MYYAVSITIFAGIQGTPITSLLSKCVETSEFGQVNNCHIFSPYILNQLLLIFVFWFLLLNFSVFYIKKITQVLAALDRKVSFFERPSLFIRSFKIRGKPVNAKNLKWKKKLFMKNKVLFDWLQGCLTQMGNICSKFGRSKPISSVRGPDFCFISNVIKGV